MNTAKRLISVLWTEPPVSNIPKRSLFDWILGAAVGVLSVADFLITDQLANPYFPALLGLLLAAALLWRRSHSLAVLLGGVIVAGALSEIADADLGSTALALAIATYALTRWSSGKHIVIGTAAILLVIAANLTRLANSSTLTGEDAAGSIAFWLFPMALGVVMRYRINVKDHRGGPIGALSGREEPAPSLNAWHSRAPQNHALATVSFKCCKAPRRSSRRGPPARHG